MFSILFRFMSGCDAVPKRFGTAFCALERLVECRRALEDSVVSAEFQSWLLAGDTGQSCPCCAQFSMSVRPDELVVPHTEFDGKGKECQEAVMRPGTFDKAEQLVKTFE